MTQFKKIALLGAIMLVGGNASAFSLPVLPDLKFVGGMVGEFIEKLVKTDMTTDPKVFGCRLPEATLGNGGRLVALIMFLLAARGLWAKWNRVEGPLVIVEVDEDFPPRGSKSSSWCLASSK